MEEKPILILFDSYLAFIKNSVGSKAFRNFYAYVNGEKKDLINGGDVACAFFASAVLRGFMLIQEPHLTVSGTVKDMTDSGWQEISTTDLKEGCVLIWADEDFDGEIHKHIGFYIGDNRAVSTDSKQGVVAEHSFDFDGTRAIEKAFWHDKLAQ